MKEKQSKREKEKEKTESARRGCKVVLDVDCECGGGVCCDYGASSAAADWSSAAVERICRPSGVTEHRRRMARAFSLWMGLVEV